MSMQGKEYEKKQLIMFRVHVFTNNNSQTVLLQFLISVQLKTKFPLRFLSFLGAYNIVFMIFILSGDLLQH